MQAKPATRLAHTLCRSRQRAGGKMVRPWCFWVEQILVSATSTQMHSVTIQIPVWKVNGPLPGQETRNGRVVE